MIHVTHSLHTTHPTIIVGTEFHVFVIPMEKK